MDMRDEGDPCLLLLLSLPLSLSLSCTSSSLSLQLFSELFKPSLPPFSELCADDLPEDVKRSVIPDIPDIGREKGEKGENSFSLNGEDGTAGGVYLCVEQLEVKKRKFEVM
jgi:hypothetical protein